MIKVTPSTKKIKSAIISHPCLVTDGKSVYMTLPIYNITANGYDNWERDAIVLVGSGKELTGTIIRALNLEMVEPYDGFVKIENDK